MTQEPRTPVVFVSYSHENREHKQWVLELAQRLRTEGIDVIIDQWDLEFGDDVPAFMTHWVSTADRVLMICTETYVQKVDEGKGGVGYEALIVTGELLQDLGTKKFVPVIRQSKEPILLPKKIGPRMAVNLSAYHASVEEEFKKLIAQLRREPPATKPPLGRAAFHPAPLAGAPLPVETPVPVDPTIAYEQALRMARSEDMVLWRRVIVAQRAAASKALLELRSKTEQSPPQNKSDLPPMLRDALTAYQSLFATALAGIESAQSKFAQQSSLIHDLLEPKGWQRNGSSIIVGLPDAAAWTFQALAGAMYVHTGQVKLALELATQRIPGRYREESQPLYQNHGLVGWPESLETTCTIAWHFLNEMPKHFPWISTAFGDEDAFRQSLAGYYLMLSWIEFLHAVANGQGPDMHQNGLNPDIPPLFIGEDPIKRGVLRLLESRDDLLHYSAKVGVGIDTQKQFWKMWVGCLEHWFSKVNRIGFRIRGYSSVILNFPEDIAR